LRRDNLGILAMLLDQQVGSAPDVEFGDHGGKDYHAVRPRAPLAEVPAQVSRRAGGNSPSGENLFHGTISRRAGPQDGIYLRRKFP
jgi:hypothetical protein